MNALAQGLGSAAALREVKHLEPSTVVALREVFQGQAVLKNRKLEIPSWSPVGNVDIVVQSTVPRDPPLAIELKWCYIDKLYEAIWDLFKMALLSTTGSQTYLFTGATPAMWRSSVGRELFEDGVHTPDALCEVRLPWGPKLRAWDDLLWGGHDKFPLKVPSRIRTSFVAHEIVSAADGEWELRAVQVSALGDSMTLFVGGWPFPRPTDAVRPLIAALRSED